MAMKLWELVGRWWQVDIPMLSSVLEWNHWIDTVRVRAPVRQCMEVVGRWSMLALTCGGGGGARLMPPLTMAMVVNEVGEAEAGGDVEKQSSKDRDSLVTDIICTNPLPLQTSRHDVTSSPATTTLATPTLATKYIDNFIYGHNR
ncbi:hypothetical protein LXL04_030014 [Taraxacum kok-saghyz]